MMILEYFKVKNKLVIRFLDPKSKLTFSMIENCNNRRHTTTQAYKLSLNLFKKLDGVLIFIFVKQN